MKKVISSDGSATLFNEQYGQTYHSVHGATTESELVYLENSGVQARLQQGLETHILEIGFGLGLNFLTTAKSALQTKAKLRYLALENAPISDEIFTSLNYQAINGFEHLTVPTAKIFKSLGEAQYAQRIFFDQIHLEVQLTNAVCFPFEDSTFDAIYLDAFSPETNPELWSVQFLKKLFQTLKPGGILSTYCVKSVVRRSFLDVGFAVKKLPGPTGKREVLLARRVSS